MTEQEFLQKIDEGYVAVIIDNGLESSWVVLSRGYCYEYNMLAFGVYPYVVWEEWEPYRVGSAYAELVTSEADVNFVYPTEHDKRIFNDHNLAEVLLTAWDNIVTLELQVHSLQLDLRDINDKLDELITDLEEHKHGND